MPRHWFGVVSARESFHRDRRQVPSKSLQFVCLLSSRSFPQAEPSSRSPYSVCFITQNVWHMGSCSGRLSFPTPGVRPFALLNPERLSSSTFTFVGFSRAEEVLLSMAPSSCSAAPARTSAIRMSLAAAAASLM